MYQSDTQPNAIYTYLPCDFWPNWPLIAKQYLVNFDMLYNVNKMQLIVKCDVILNRKKYTDTEWFQLSALLGNIVWIEMYFLVYVSAAVGSKPITEIPLILILRGPRKTVLPPRERSELY